MTAVTMVEGILTYLGLAMRSLSAKHCLPPLTSLLQGPCPFPCLSLFHQHRYLLLRATRLLHLSVFLPSLHPGGPSPRFSPQRPYYASGWLPPRAPLNPHRGHAPASTPNGLIPMSLLQDGHHLHLRMEPPPAAACVLLMSPMLLFRSGTPFQEYGGFYRIRKM